MKIGNATFDERIEKEMQNDFMRGAVSEAQDRLEAGRLRAADVLGNWEEWRSLGEEIRQHVLMNLDDYLYQFSEEVEKRGGYVFFAQTAEEANDYIVDVAKRKNAKKIGRQISGAYF